MASRVSGLWQPGVPAPIADPCCICEKRRVEELYSVTNAEVVDVRRVLAAMRRRGYQLTSRAERAPASISKRYRPGSAFVSELGGTAGAAINSVWRDRRNGDGVGVGVGGGDGAEGGAAWHPAAKKTMAATAPRRAAFHHGALIVTGILASCILIKRASGADRTVNVGFLLYRLLSPLHLKHGHHARPQVFGDVTVNHPSPRIR